MSKAGRPRKDAESIEEVVARHREALIKDIEKIDPTVFVELGWSGGHPELAKNWSDWHDTFDRNTWYKTWGKSGEKKVIRKLPRTDLRRDIY